MRRDGLDDLLERAEIDALFRPTAEALGLPGRAYHDQDFYELECRRLFARGWMAAAFVQDLPDPGDVFPVSIAGWELLFVRDRDGGIRCFHNICRHRGMRLVAAPGKGARSLSCPWHCWTYDLDGRLIGTPNLGGSGIGEAEGFDPARLGLLPVRCASWWNYLFVDIGGEAPPLEEHLRPLKARIREFDLGEAVPGGIGFDYAFSGNWKVLIEGGVEDYHFPWVHPQLMPQGAFRPEVGGDCFLGISSRPTEPGGVAKMIGKTLGPGSRALPRFSHHADPAKVEMGVYLVFPTGIFALNPDHAVTTLFIPVAHDRTLARRQFHFIGEDAARAPEFAEARANVLAAWKQVGDQDSAYVEEVQRMSKLREALALETRFSPFWEPAVHHFQKLVVERLRA